MKSETGQSLIELLIAIGVFIVIISSLAFFILNSYVSGRLAEEVTKANFLAEEGIEATISIRDNTWNNLIEGYHGLAIFGNNWVFQEAQEDINSQLKGGIRTIKIENIGSDRKKVTSQITWQFIEAESQEVQLVTYLTNWQKITIYCQGTCASCSDFLEKKSCNKQDGCSWITRDRVCAGICTPCDNFSDQTSCEAQSGCIWAGI